MASTHQSSHLNEMELRKRNQLQRDKPYVFEKVQKYRAKILKGESIAIVRLVYDYTCNFHCQHCSEATISKKGGHAFTVSDVRELSKQADEMGLAHFVLTGGEPLLFPEYDKIIEAIDPDKFYISSDTNGWFLNLERAKHLKKIGVDKIQLSLDSLNPEDHDQFRGKKGAYERAMRAIDAALEADLNIIVQTVVSKQRVRSEEFLRFLERINGKGVGVFVTYAKPVGDWEGNFDVLVNREDMRYMEELEKRYQVFTHLTPAYGLDLGCIAVKRMISITKYGDVMPCPYIYVSLGNVFEESLQEIIERGLNIKFFGKYFNSCWIAENRKFIHEYVEKKIYGKTLPVSYTEVFSELDFISKSQRCLCKENATANHGK
ncbi:radical SAM/SPASM domain-containing protein [Desulfatirhabdium butyrativorans]|uniref:radical SAM/SPASM domain-containing protein n=1 Tax=Desulfatirhabdium butyrativorans TaxID=340467 RepID=UPI00146FB445|nr:radical SAM protein [Desulfatirhabdium butyrativorans]